MWARAWTFAIAFGAIPEAHAQCPIAPLYTVSTNGSAASTPGSDTSFNNFNKSITYVAQGTYLYALDNGRSGTPATYWTSAPFASSIQNFPSPVPLAGNHNYIFVANGDGHLYKIDAQTGAQSGAAADTRRGSCSTDTLTATPTVQLNAYSNAAFQTAMVTAGHSGEDLVFVVTHFAGAGSCSTYSRNKIFAYYASDLSLPPKWVFNNTGAYQIDFGSEGCSLDYDNNRIYCGTNQPSGRNQNTVWAISTVDGSLLWSVNAGSVRARPMLANGKIYVGNYTGTLRVLKPSDGTELWNLAVTASTISNNVWPEFRGGYAPIVLLRDDAGVMRAVNDLGASGSLAWATSNAITVTTMPAVLPTLGKVYAGLSDGTIHQFDLSSGLSEASSAVIPGGSGSVYDPSLDTSSAQATTVDRLVAVGTSAGTGQARRYCIPWVKGSIGTTSAPNSPDSLAQALAGVGCASDADCTDTGACFTSKCDTASQVCYRVPLTGTPCDDGLVCSCSAAHQVKGVCDKSPNSDVCAQGVCTADFYQVGCGVGACVNLGDRGCPVGSACCGQGQCVDLTTSDANCGACGTACATGTSCVNGACRRGSSACSYQGAAALNALAAQGQLTSASAIVYDRENGSVCDAFLSVFHTNGQSDIKKLSGGGVASVVADLLLPVMQGPLNGLAVTSDGTAHYGAISSDGGFAPGLAVDQLGQLGALTAAVILPASRPTSGSAATGFSTLNYDNGPVGPAFDEATYATNGDQIVYFGNWSANGDLVKLSCLRAALPCVWSLANVTWRNPQAERVSAITLAGARLYVAHGTSLSIVDAAVQRTQTDLDLTNASVFDLHLNEGNVAGVLALATDPLYLDVYAELRNRSGDSFVVQVRSDDNSVRNLYDVGIDFFGAQSATPSLFVGAQAQGRLTLDARATVMRMVPALEGQPLFQEWSAAP